MCNLNIIENQPPNKLPLSLAAWLDPQTSLPSGVQYIRGQVPMSFFVYCLGIIPLLGMSILLFLIMSLKLSAGQLSQGHLLVFLIAGSIFLGSAIWLTVLGRRAQHHRRAHQNKTSRAGYFMGTDVFLGFDGDRVWLIPKNRIVSVIHSKDMKRKASGIHYRHGHETVFYPIHESYQTLLKIQHWHRD